MFAPEGLWFIAAGIFLTSGSVFALLLTKHKIWFITSLLGMLIWIGMLIFFRDPLRPPPDPSAIVSPSDGTVDEIEVLENGQTRIAIYLSLLNVHTVRSPVSGVVLESTHHPGKHHPAFDPKASIENEYHQNAIQTDHGEVVLRTLAGFMARRVLNYLSANDSVLAGERIGFVRFGSRAEILLPNGFTAGIRVNDRVFGGVTILGEFTEPNDGGQQDSDQSVEATTAGEERQQP